MSQVHPVRGGTNCTRDRLCRTCHAPLPEGRRLPYCTDCRRAYFEQRAALPGRRCSDCRALLPEGRISYRCRDCKREANRWYDRARPGRTCTSCRQPLPEARASRRCAACARAYRIGRYGTGACPCTRCGEVLRFGWQHSRCQACLDLADVERILREQRITRQKATQRTTAPNAAREEAR